MMHSLSEIALYAPPDYQKYFSKKTGFLLTESGSRRQPVRWLWHHLIRIYDFDKVIPRFSTAEKNSLCFLMNNFGHILEPDEHLQKMEEKTNWIFRHPQGGIFVPLEIIKLFMKEPFFQERHFLFSLLYRLPTGEQKFLASLCGSSLEGQVSISFEDNKLDMALVLYIWLSNELQNIKYLKEILPAKKKVLHTPYASDREKKIQNINPPEKNFFPGEPTPLWDYLIVHFSQHREDIEKLNTLVKKAGKGFYRSFSLLDKTESDMVNFFKKGIIFPIMPARKKGVDPEILAITPSEFHTILGGRLKVAPPENTK